MTNGNINPWTNLWIHPKKTIRHLIDTAPQKNIRWLAFINGLLMGIPWLMTSWERIGEKGGSLRLLLSLVVLVLGGLLSLAYLYLGGWLFRLTGSWLSGKGSFNDVKCAIGWVNWPSIIAALFGIFSFLSFSNVWLQSAFGLVNVILAVWTLIIFCNVVGEAHRFSAWKAALAALIGWVLVLVVLAIISLTVPLLAPLFS